MQNIWLKFLGLLMFSLMGQTVWALSCFEGTTFNGKKYDTVNIASDILVPNGMTKPGTILWRSSTYTTQFTCFDTDNQPNGEDAYLYWDPQKRLGSIHNSIALGITIDGIDHPLTAQRFYIGRATVRDARNARNNCAKDYYSRYYSSRGCAKPQTITVAYSIFIKSTGNAPPSQGNIPNTGTYSIFQVDGYNGLNRTRPDANFNLKISGLNRIRFVNCNPQVSIEGNLGSTIDFGKIQTKARDVNQIISRKTFAVKADLSQPDSGGVCNGKMLMASFNTSNSANTTTILPQGRKDIGIQIFKQNASQPLSFNTPVELSLINNGVAYNQFDAGLLQMAAQPAAGVFNATAIVEVTFK